MRIVNFVVLLSLCVSTVALSATLKRWAPTPQLIAEVEKTLTLPKGASALEKYSRYYSGQAVGVEKYIVGVFLLGSRKGGVRILPAEKMPQVFDGGCNVIRFKYDVKRRRVLSLFCSGVA